MDITIELKIKSVNNDLAPCLAVESRGECKLEYYRAFNLERCPDKSVIL